MGKHDACGPPPTIRNCLDQGIVAFFATCVRLTCRHEGRVLFADLGMPETTVFVDLPRSKRFRCTACGGRRIEAFPDWRDARGGQGSPPSTWGMMPP